jgi:hypothetical protein
MLGDVSGAIRVSRAIVQSRDESRRMSIQWINQSPGPFCKIMPATNKIFATTSFFFSRSVPQNPRTAAWESTLHHCLQPGPAALELAGCLMWHRKPVGTARDAGGQRKSWRSSRRSTAAGAAWTKGFGTKSTTATGDGADCRRLTDLRIQRASVRRFNLGAQAVGAPHQMMARFSFFIYCCTRWRKMIRWRSPNWSFCMRLQRLHSLIIAELELGLFHFFCVCF